MKPVQYDPESKQESMQWTKKEKGRRINSRHESRTEATWEVIARSAVLQDNASVHTARVSRQALKDTGFSEIDHAPYSPDLAPSDYFFQFKKELRGRRFVDDNQMKMAVESHFDCKEKEYFLGGLRALYTRCEKSAPRTHEDPRSSNYSPILSEHSIDDERTVNNAPVTSVSSARVGRALTLDNMKECDERDGWNYNIHTLQRQEFSTDNLVHLQHIPKNASIFTIYRLFVDDEALELKVQQTNLYVEQTKVTYPGGRMARWKPVDKAEMEKFL
ncbi:Mariner Mos1 transposase [Eumeta japonica]|uniref:Mariner Mos1 transposase n=1 Tax=Eumeta variegata TaxID=151549 RepID=A0A4C1TF47_EUMVA|nr:Mariner Mos1 transposase [Eumeta japonica]